jgi:hypothetical protein
MLNSLRKAVGLAGSETPHTKYHDMPGDHLAGSNAAVNLKKWQLASGRTRSKVEELTSLLASARKLAVDKNQVAGGIVVDGDDASAAVAEAQHAENSVRILESALAVAIQKDEAAQRELEKAQRAAATEAEYQVYFRLKEAAAEIDEYLARGKALLEQRFVPAYNDALEIASDSTVDVFTVKRVQGGLINQIYHKFAAVMPQGKALQGLTPYLDGLTLSDLCPDPNAVKARRKA